MRTSTKLTFENPVAVFSLQPIKELETCSCGWAGEHKCPTLDKAMPIKEKPITVNIDVDEDEDEDDEPKCEDCGTSFEDCTECEACEDGVCDECCPNDHCNDCGLRMGYKYATECEPSGSSVCKDCCE